MGSASERRDGPRIDLRLRVRFEGDGTSGEAEASDVSPRGLRLESEGSVEPGTVLNMTLDAGDDEELTGTGRVTWCRARKSHAGRDMFDIGVHFDHDWLAQDRGPLGTALARIFAMNSHEPARNYERTKVSLDASTSSSPPVTLEIVDLSTGGMQLRAPAGLGTVIKGGVTVIVEVQADGETHSLAGKVVWRSERDGVPCFGVQFEDVGDDDDRFLAAVQKGEIIPQNVTVFLQ